MQKGLKYIGKKKQIVNRKNNNNNNSRNRNKNSNRNNNNNFNLNFENRHFKLNISTPALNVGKIIGQALGAAIVNGIGKIGK